MQRKALSLTAIIFSVALLSACGSKTLTLSSYDGTKTVEIRVEIADNPKEREKGLMDRAEMMPDTGMLFAFTEPQILTFWMKNTLVPLDIMFFDAAGDFVSGLSMEPCTVVPCPTYRSAALATYAVEVVKGYREAHDIGTGWKIDIKRAQKISKPS